MPPRKRPPVEPLRNKAPISSFIDQTSGGGEADSSPTAVPITKIQLPEKQPRHYFDPETLEHLAQSIKEYGILEPLLVRPLQKGTYELIAGERRLRAAQLIGLAEVPIIAHDLDDQQALQVALMENLQREDLNPVEETEGVLELLAIALSTSRDEVITLLGQANNARNRDQKLKDNVILQLEKVESVLAVIGKFTAESFRVNRLPLLNLPEDVLEKLRQGKLEYTKARAISRVKDDRQRKAILKDAIAKNLSLSQIKEQITALLEEEEEKQPETIQQQFSVIYKQIQKSKVWNDPKKQRKLEKIMSDLRSLLSE
jgi:ParB family chromosome partitioning protein